MSAVAGAVALKVGENLKKRFGIKEVIVENGGDIYADLCQDMDISVFAGSSPLSEKVGLHIEAAYAPLGICTSSGTVGPSLRQRRMFRPASKKSGSRKTYWPPLRSKTIN